MISWSRPDLTSHKWEMATDSEKCWNFVSCHVYCRNVWWSCVAAGACCRSQITGRGEISGEPSPEIWGRGDYRTSSLLQTAEDHPKLNLLNHDAGGTLVTTFMLAVNGKDKRWSAWSPYPTFEFELAAGCSRALQHGTETLRAGIRDGDGMKKSGSKHHTKAGPGPEAGCCHQSYELFMSYFSFGDQY